MDYISPGDFIVTEAVKMEDIPEMKMVRKQVVLSQGIPVGRGNMCFLYTKDINQSIKMMSNNDNFMTKNHYLLYFYPSIYNGRLYNKKFRFRETDKRQNYCDLVNNKVKTVRGYDRAVLNMSEKRNIFVDLHRYIEIFESICGNVTPSRFMNFYWEFFKSIISSYDNYAATYPNRYMIVDLKNFTMTKSLKENLHNPLYMLYYTMYKNYKLLKGIDLDIYFYNGKKVLLVNPSHSDEDSYKILRTEMKRVSEGLSKNVVDGIDHFTSDDKIKQAEKVEEPASDIISKVYDKNTIDDASSLLDKSPVNFSVAPVSNVVSRDITDKVANAKDEVTNKFNATVAKLNDEEPLKDANKANTPKDDSKVNKTPSVRKEIDDKVDNVINDAITNKAEENINKDEELISKIYDDLRKTSAMQKPASKREEMLRKAQYDVMISGTTIKDLQKINAKNIKIESHDVSGSISDINKNMSTITFNQFEKTYNEKLMKKDIVNAILALNDKSMPFYVVSIDIKDSSDVLNYKDTYKITLEDSNKKRHIVTVDIPKFIEDKFLYINGNKMMIKHQSFFYPVVKVNEDTVHITTNYNKIIISRNAKRGVSSVERFKKLLKNNETLNGLCTFGNVFMSNVSSITTIDYDDLSKIIAEYKSKDGKTHIFFSQESAKEEARNKNLKLSDDLMFIGYNKGEPSYINIKTGRDSKDNSIVDIIIDSLPDDVKDQFSSIKHPKILTFAQCRIMEKTVKCGVLISFWRGFSNLIKDLNVEYRLENKSPRELASDEDYIIFNDCVFIYKANTTNTLILSGLSDLNTKDINIADMDSKETYIPYLLKVYGNAQIENALMNFYEFLIDPITKEILIDMNMPTTVTGLMIYAINLLGDSQYIPEINMGLSRIRSNEIVAAILYERLAKNYVLYRNSNGRKKYSVPQNAVISEVVAQNTVDNYSTLNPFLELQMSHFVSARGFRGSNKDRAYKTEKRSFDPSMTGTISAITSPDGNVGINKQLTLEPRITNARGYVDAPQDIKGIEANKDVNIFSPVELTMPCMSMYDDSTRGGHAVKQSIQCLPVKNASPVLITNGFDEAVRFHLSHDFIYNAEEDGEVIDFDTKSEIMIIRYKSGKVRAIDLSSTNLVRNSANAFYLENKLVTNYKVGDKFKKDDLLAYHKDFFTNSKYNNCRLNVGTLTKVALMSTYNTYEDGTFITNKLAKDASTEMVFDKGVVVGKNSNIEYIVSKGDKVLVGDSLIQFDTSFDDDSINTLLANMSEGNREAILENSRNDVKTKVSGTVEAIKIYATVDLDEMSESLRKLCSAYYREINHKNNFLNKYDPDNAHSVVKCGLFTNEVSGKVKPNMYGMIKNKEVNDGVLIEFYIKHSEPLEVGSKIAK